MMVGVEYAETAPSERRRDESLTSVNTTNIRPVSAAAEEPMMT
jgi:hypothetical protein